MTKNPMIRTLLLFLVTSGIVRIAAAQIEAIYHPEFPAPKSQLTRWSFLAEMDADIPLVILINRSGQDFDYTQLEITVDDKLGTMAHGTLGLKNGEQRIIAPYIRKGGKGRLVYTYGSWYSSGPLQAGIPMILTIYPHKKIMVNQPYSRLSFGR